MESKFKGLLCVVFLVLVVCFVRFYNVPSDSELVDDAGFLYLQDADSFKFAKEIKEGDFSDGNPLFQMVGFVWHKFLSLFNPNITVGGSLGLIPVLFVGLTVLNIFFIVVSFCDSFFAGLLAGLLFAINKQIYFFTYVGNGDYNSLILFFMTLFVLFMLKYLKENKFKFSLGAGIVMILFALLWRGWFLILLIFALAFVMFLLIEGLRREQYWACCIALLVSVISFVSFMIITQFYDGLLFSSFGFDFVDELRREGLFALLHIDNFGLVVLVLVFGAFLTFNSRDFHYYLIYVWFVSMSLMSMVSLRFVFYAIIPFSILAGLLFYDFNKFMLKGVICKEELFFKKCILLGVIILLFTILFNMTDYNSDRVFIMEDSVNTLGSVSFPEEVKILSVWQYGYLIEYLTDKEVRFKGSPRVSHLVINALLLKNESEAKTHFINTVGSPVYVILFDRDYTALINNYEFEKDSMLLKFKERKSELFELVHESHGTHNGVEVWKVK